ncbi:membrane-associated guanylate kinase, WW and PDZ domain-containing protein 3 [Grus japonensis]|uniref:Membrane-associated guanylate kinase, WW and PDZ domain-containing protein 3 n=1 Tax=Grus japonensis TaxID=30415 RepID=A0ABC9XTY9_GRUJA
MTVEQLKGGNGKPGVTRKDTKQKSSGKMEGWSPEWQYAAFGESNLPLSDSRRNTSEGEKMKKSNSGEPSSSRFKTSSLSNIPLLSMEKQRRLETQETVTLNRQRGERHMELPDETKDDGISKSESSSPVKKTPITPGPWRVPSACKVTQTAGVAEKRV